MTDTKMK